ncbi:S-adenosyl-L-methionine-dependent methyltransferase, partial [Basidiobolus meristosporus CBS 931.73]
ILQAIDSYADIHPLIHVGNRKGKVIDELITQKPVQVMIELGGYLGYSAIRFGNKLPPTGHYYSFEFDPEFAEVANKIIDHAGLSSKVTIVIGEFQLTCKTFSEKYGVNKVEFVFIDHKKDVYVQDIKNILRLQWLNIGATVVADNILYPGAPEYKAYIESRPE